MSCIINRGKEGQIISITSKSGNPSILFEKFRSLGLSEEETLKLYAQIYTKSFKQWYGDWENSPLESSKYLDENGEPMVFFHGTNEKFDKFDASKRRYNTHDISKGIFFSQDVNHAKKYGNNIIPVFLKAETVEKTQPTDEMLNKISSLQALRQYESNVINTTKADSVELLTNDKEGIKILQNVVFDPNNILFAKKEDIITLEERAKPTKQKMLMEQSVEEASAIDNIKLERMFYDALESSININDENSLDIIKATADRLSEKTGVEYDVISAEEAREITKDAENPYTNQKAFYYNGKVYFVEGQMTLDTVFHEFSHPFVSALRTHNKPVYDKIVSDLLSTPEGVKLLEESAKEYGTDISDYRVTDEAIVKAMEKEMLKNSPEFTSVLKKILFAIRQMLRKLFGKSVKVDKLKTNTTVAELANILKSKYVTIEPYKITNEDYVAYKQRSSQLITEMTDSLNKNLDDSQVLLVLNTFYDHISRELNVLRKSQNIEGLKELLANVYGKNAIQEKADILGEFETITHKNYNEKLDKLTEDVNLTSKRSRAIVRSMVEAETMLELANPKLKNIANQPEIDLTDLQMIDAFSQTVESYENFINSIAHYLDESEFPVNDNFKSLIDNVRGKLITAKNTIHKINMRGVGEVLIKQTRELRDGLIKEREKLIEEAKDESIKNKYRKEIDLLNNADEQIKEILANNAKDASMFSFLTSPANAKDVILSGYADIIKTAKIKAQVETQKEANNLLKEMESLLKELETNKHFQRVDAIGSLLTYKETKKIRNKDGKLEDREVYAFIEKYKSFKPALDEMKYNVSESKRQWEKSGSDEHYKEYIKAKAILEKHKLNFFQKPYVDSFYKPKEILLSTTKVINGQTFNVGEIAFTERAELLEKITEQTAKASSEEETEQKQKDLEILDSLWQDYKKMFSLIDTKGNRKEGLELAKAEALKEYRNSSRKFFTYTLREGAFESALAHHENYLQSIGITEEEKPEEYHKLRERWISKNIRKSPNDKYFEDLNQAYDGLVKLLEKAGLETPEEINKARESIQDIKSFNKDQNNEVSGYEMPINLVEEIRNLDQKISDIKDTIPGLNGLTPAENRELALLEGNDMELTPAEEKRIKELNYKRDNVEISATLRIAISNQFKKIAQITTKEATTDYVDILNEFIGSIEGGTAHIQAEMGVDYISKDNADEFIKEGVYVKFLKDEDFKAWFEKAHIKRKAIKKETVGDMTYVNEVDSYTRTSVWSNNVPASNKYLGKIQIKDTEGNTIETIYGQPIFEYYDRDVKDIYKTKAVVGETVDVWGNYLPKPAEKMDKSLEGWDRYQNAEYERLKSQNPTAFKLLQVLLKYHYKAQEGVEDSAKLGNEIPRFRIDMTETLQKGGLWNKTKSALTQVADKIRTTKDDAEELGLNPNNLDVDSEDIDTYLSLLGQINPKSALYIRGKFNIDIDLVSLDVISGVMRYMHSAIEQKSLIEIHPMAKALQSVIDQTDAKGVEELNKKAGLSLGPITLSTNKKDKTTRAKAIEAITEREFYGKKITGIGAKNPGLSKIVNLLTGETARSYLGMNFPSDIKNRFSQTTHNFYSMVYGKDISPKSFAKGKLFGAQLIAEVSRQRYKRGAKSLNMQLLEVFDIMEDRFVSKLGEYATSSATRDIVNMSWTTSFRKLMEQEGAFELFGALLHQQKVEIVGEDGVTTEIPLKDAYELVDDQIKLKDSVKDKEWEIGGKKFIAYKKKMQTVLESTAGAYSEFSQPLIDRHIEFKAFIALRKYAYSMWRRRLNGASIDPDAKNYWDGLWKTFKTGERHAGGTFDVGYGDIFTGYYAEAAIGLAVMANKLGQGKAYTLTKDEKGAMRVVAAEFIMTVVILSALMMMLGYEDDDKDRFKKMRSLSGPLPLPWVEQDNSRPAFDLGGWLHAHTIYQLMMVRGENSQFSPSISGLSELSKFKDGTSVIWGPTVDKIITLFQDISRLASGDERAYYKRDIGPFSWQKKDSWKFWNHLFQSFYFRGKAVDPGKGIKDQATFENIR